MSLTAETPLFKQYLDMIEFPPQLKDEGNSHYQLFLAYLTIPRERRTVNTFIQRVEGAYKASTIKQYSGMFAWAKRAEQFDEQMAKLRILASIQSDVEIDDADQKDLINQSLSDYRSMRSVWLEALREIRDRQRRGEPTDTLELQRLVGMYNSMNNMARKAMGLPTSISSSLSRDSNEDTEKDPDGYILTTDGLKPLLDLDEEDE